MNLAELYSLTAGAKINKPYTLPKFFPLPFDKYIYFQPFSKKSKSYSRWQVVIGLIGPELEKNGIKIIQCGAKDETPIHGCHHLQGKTSWNQSAFLIKNSLLVLSTDSISAHFAGAFDKKMVVLYSNNRIHNTKPYNGTLENQILIEPPDRDRILPSYSLDEGPNQQIDKILPEVIAKSVLKLLNIPFEFPYETLFFGAFFNNRIIEMVPTQAISLQNLGIDNMIIRADFHFNESVIAQQLSVSNCSIITEKPLNIDLIKQFLPRIKQLIYIIDKNYDLNFIKFLHKTGINYVLMSYLSEEELNEIKLDFLDFNMIIRKDKINSEYDKKLDVNTKVFFASNKFTLADSKIYPSKSAWLEKKEIPGLTSSLNPVIVNEDWKSEMEHFWVLKKKENNEN